MCVSIIGVDQYIIYILNIDVHVCIYVQKYRQTTFALSHAQKARTFQSAVSLGGRLCKT